MGLRFGLIVNNRATSNRSKALPSNRLEERKEPRDAGLSLSKDGSDLNYADVRAYEIRLNTLPIWGPRRVRIAITTIATRTRINAYSTNPWPSSRLRNNISFYLLYKIS